MKLEKKKVLLVSFMLFSLFFGAGNLIFPPFLGQCAGKSMPLAMAGFLITAVVLPVLGVIVVAKFNGLQKLANKVNTKFAIIFTVLIYLSIGPGLGIPRAASVPFEMAIAPYLPQGASFGLFMLGYSLVFFLVAMWLALAPNKLVDRIGKVLTPTLLILLVVMFGTFLFKGKMDATEALVPAYNDGPFVKGFLEGYQTMDAIAALNFGLVISITIRSLLTNNKSNEKDYKSDEQTEKTVIHYTKLAGVFAGTILSVIYIMLSFMGMQSSGVYELQDNGAWTLRCIVHELFGEPGAIFLATVFTLACLTTCVGLITSISQYFSTLFSKLSYRTWVFVITGFSFLVCNQGLTTILGISVPVLNAIYPVSIMLIVLGLAAKLFKDNKFMFPFTIFAVTVVSVLYALEGLVPLGFVSTLLHKLPFYSLGMGWVLVAVVFMALALLTQFVVNKVNDNKKANSNA